MISRRYFIPIFISAVALLAILSIASNARFIQDSLFYRVIVLWILYGIIKYVESILRLQFPGPIPIPVVGNGLDLVSGENLQESIRSLNEKYGNYVDLSLIGGKAFLLINDVDFCKAVMKSTDRGMISGRKLSNDSFILNYVSQTKWVDLWGNNDITTFLRSNDLGDWKSHRRLIQPAFDQKHVRAMVPKFSTSVYDLIQKLMLRSGTGMREPEGSGDSGNDFEVLDLMPFLQEFALDFSMGSLLGVSLNMAGEDASSTKDTGTNTEGSGGGARWIIDAFKLQCKLFKNYQFDSGMVLRLKVGILPVLGLNKLEKERRKRTNRLRSFIRTIYEKEEKRQIIEESNENTNTSDDSRDASLSSLISILVASSRAQKKGKYDDQTVLSDEDIMDEIGQFMFAGFDTVATTLSIFFYHIATNPLVQKKIHDEIDAAIARSSSKYTKESSENQAPTIDFAGILQENALPYLSACIREFQRIQPVSPLILRRTEQAIELKTGKTRRTIPKGTSVFVPVYLIQRNESYYKDPDTFMPERWLESIVPEDQCNNSRIGDVQAEGKWKLKPVPKGLFYAFGGGPKMCVGFQLADKELKISALGILSHFTLQNPDCGEMKIEDNFVAGPASMKLKVTRRSWTETQKE